jgi:hypothetical protein
MLQITTAATVAVTVVKTAKRYSTEVISLCKETVTEAEKSKIVIFPHW